MKNIYDYINESILDDFDDLENKTDNIISKNWFETYATGNFKVKISKKGITKITGDIIIKGYEGEDFSGLNISELKGNMYIEKCPNLKSTKGLCVNSLKTGILPIFHGSFSINNCPNLTELKDCPWKVVGDFSLVGNKSLKSLDGAPEMIFNNAHIMKNGKKFDEKYVRDKMYVYDYIFCSNEENEADICESEELYEELNNSYLLMLAKQLKDYGKSFKNILGNRNIAWDEIDTSNIHHYSWRFKKPSEQDIKAARAIISGKDRGYIITYVYDENDKIIFKEIISDIKTYAYITKNSYSSWATGKSTELINDIIGSVYDRTDGMIIIKIDNDLTTYKKHSDRLKSRAGMVHNTPEYYAQVARENMQRYKKIIETNRAKNNSKVVENLQKKVNEFLQNIMTASNNVMKNPSKYANDLFFLKTLNEYAYSQKTYTGKDSYGKNGVLILFNTYMSIWANAAVGGENYTYGSNVEEKLKNIEISILKIIKEAQHYLNKFDV